MASRAAELVAGVIDRVEGRPHRPGRPPLPAIEVVETLRFFAREGVRWREPRAAAGRAGGPTPRRRLDERAAAALPRGAGPALVRMVPAGPEAGPGDVVVDSCPVRAEPGGEPTGPDPTDRGEAGTGYHVVASTDGLPPGVVPSAVDVHDTRLFPRLPRPARMVCAAIGKLCADAGYDSAESRGLCLRDGIQPCVRQVGAPHGSGPGTARCIVEHDCARLLADKRLDRRHDRLGRVVLALLTAARIFVVANRLRPF